MAWYRCLYAPRAGGAYDSHHRTAGIAGSTRRRGGRRRGGLEDAADDSAIGEHIEVVIIPLARRPSGRVVLSDVCFVVIAAARPSAAAYRSGLGRACSARSRPCLPSRSGLTARAARAPRFRTTRVQGNAARGSAALDGWRINRSYGQKFQTEALSTEALPCGSRSRS